MANHGLEKHEYRYLLQAFELEPNLRAYLRRKLRNESIVDDLMQQLYLELLKAGGPNGWEISSVRAWSFKFARNRVSDHFRGHRTSSIDDIEDERQLDSGVDITEAADAERNSVNLRRAIPLLPNSIREAVCLRLYGGRNYEEIAISMGTSEDTVGQYLSRGRRLLSVLLGATSSDRAGSDRQSGEAIEE